MPTTPPASDGPAPVPAALAEKTLAELRTHADPDNLAGMARYGISAAGTLGVSMPVVRGLARDIKRELGRDQHARHEAAAVLWASGVHEARIMASLVDAPALVTAEQMDAWASDLDSWDVCDTLCNNLFRLAPGAWDKAAEWTSARPEFTKRAGFVLSATFAVHDKARPDAEFSAFLDAVERECTDERNNVKKAVNWALRQIGKRSPELNAQALATCDRILAAHGDCVAARWVARDALRELRSEAVRVRLGIA